MYKRGYSARIEGRGQLILGSKGVYKQLMYGSIDGNIQHGYGNGYRINITGTCFEERRVRSVEGVSSLLCSRRTGQKQSRSLSKFSACSRAAGLVPVRVCSLYVHVYANVYAIFYEVGTVFQWF